MEAKITVAARYIAALKLFVGSKDRSRPYLNGIAMEIGAKETRLIATDGHRLAVVRVESEQPQVSGVWKDIILPPMLFDFIKKPDGDVKITVGPAFSVSDPERPVLGFDRPVSVFWNGMSVKGYSLNESAIDWRKVMPANTSGEAAQFNPIYVGDLGKVAKLVSFGKTNLADIGHNGEAGALVFFRDENIQGVIMPVRAVAPSTGYDWIHDPLTNYPDTAAV